MKTIQDFLNDSTFSFPAVPTGTASSIEEFYENCIKTTLQKDSSIVKEWHNLLVEYSKDSESILLSRLYESRKVNGQWDTRRGMETIMNDNFSYAFASNFFARIIYSMVYVGFVPEYKNFKDMFINHIFSLYSFIGTTDCERKYSSFVNKAYKPVFYTQGWYLAHIISINDEQFYKFPNVNIKEILVPGKLSDWKLFNNIYKRKLNYSFTNDEKKIIIAHFLRFIDPINYFLVPNQNNINVKSIGENKNVVDYILRRSFEVYGDSFINFLDLALVDKNTIPKQNLSDLGKEKIFTLKFSNKKSNVEKIIPVKSQKNNLLQRNLPNNDDIIQKISYYKSGNISKGFSETSLRYANDYIDVVSYSHSNKWLDSIHSNMEKMWSIIYKPKHSFSMLKNWNKLINSENIEITDIKKGQHIGKYAIRIRGMKKSPNDEIIKEILEYIFAK
ncbi:hypothetical protein HMPREF1222_01482 [Treponema vincentii F0403]|uniref:Uncharacterized protein n=1 Tax=Treponema vincentii F0403 TaxID=1125702 RepID=S3LBG3_9SPIR|nr:hypothetical protein [Treponema vincentii]EPF46901.1 hypothetical protein HMPREF1222_01482 [Treponema vincentii F0403]